MPTPRGAAASPACKYMRTVSASAIRNTVAELCIRANRQLPPDVCAALSAARSAEPWPVAGRGLDILLDNLVLAEKKQLPICQDTGMACVFLELGQDVHIDGDLDAAVQDGVRDGYARGYLRCSVVADPLRRTNTGDNTPGMLTVRIVPGDKLRITVLPKGFGSENMSRLAMLTPADGAEGVRRFVIDTVRAAGPNPCPPIVVGVGIGGDFEQAALMAKHATARPLGQRHPDPRYAALELRALDAINALGIGAAGYGGLTTVLNVAIESAPTHIAGLPVAVNICCHASRHAETTI